MIGASLASQSLCTTHRTNEKTRRSPTCAHAIASQSKASAHYRLMGMMVSQEPEWHRMIAEAAYYLAQKRGFSGEHSLEDWLAAEQQVRQVISPILDSKVTMTDTDGVQGDAKKPDKTIDEKLGANMADRK